MKVIIAGSRSFFNFALLSKKVGNILRKIPKEEQIEIVSGNANGADKLGEKYGYLMGYKVTRFPADWDTHGKAAGYIRNVEMAKYADALIAFWDGESRGTAHMIKTAEDRGLLVRVIRYEKKV